MFDATWDFVRTLLGLGAEDLNAGQMAVRAILTFAVTIAVLRLGDKRLLGKGTAFDVIVAIMIGSVMSRAINGSAPLVGTWIAGIALIGMHWLLALIAFRTGWFGPLIKGNPVLLVKDGEVRWDAMREASVTRMDLEQAIREEGYEPDLSRIARACLERDGTISVIRPESEPKVLEVAVRDGVQTVRIALE